jgi:hypothetical protein
MKTLSDYQVLCDTILAQTTPEVRGLLKRIKARDLYPHLLGRVCSALEALAAQGHLFWITQGERTWEEQNKLYSYGRTDMSRGVVTKVSGGASAHNYGVAVDAAFDEDGDLKTGLQPSWDKPWMKIWADACQNMGLEAGYYWSGFFDGPHVQLPLINRGILIVPSPKYKTMPSLKETYQKGGKLAVFKLLDTKNWSK